MTVTLAWFICSLLRIAWWEMDRRHGRFESISEGLRVNPSPMWQFCLVQTVTIVILGPIALALKTLTWAEDNS